LFNDNYKKNLLLLNNSYAVGFFPARDFAVGIATFTHQFFSKLVFFYKSLLYRHFDDHNFRVAAWREDLQRSHRSLLSRLQYHKNNLEVSIWFLLIKFSCL